jgi:hypothetical protein
MAEGRVTKARAWPNGARETRDRSAERAAEILSRARSLIEKSGDPEVLRQVGHIVDLASGILRLLEHEGACTRPE